MFKRIIDLPKNKTFFLWGPRKSGKSSLLHQVFPKSPYFDLLLTDLVIKYSSNPSLFREEALALHQRKENKGLSMVIDEIQKVPELLNEVHWLIENHKINFVLCGSSARKLKKGQANLLGGRAWKRELFGLSAYEIGKEVNLGQLLNRGYIPSHYTDPDFRELQRAYVSDYLKEEILNEGLSRNLPAFSHFLSLASLSDTELIQFKTFAADTGVSAPTVKSYFEILEDTLIGLFLHVYRHRPKRRLQFTPKFYFFDVGVVNQLAKRGELKEGSELWGKAFENWVFHELRCFKAYKEPDLDLHFWRLSTDVEVDFILGRMEVAIEVKASARIHSEHLKGLRSLKEDHPSIKKRIVVCMEKQARLTEDGILILPYGEFISALWQREIVG